MDILDITIKLSIALLLGMIIGFERILTKHDAGVRTYGLVSMGSALFMIVAVPIGLSTNTGGEILRVIGQIVTGIGFLGAGLIFNSEKEHRRIGLTSAAGMWVCAGIGITCGLGFYTVAIVATALTLITLTLMWTIEHKMVAIIKGDFKKEVHIEKIK